MDHRNGKTFVDTGSSMNVAELAGNHQQRQDGNGISSGDGSGTTSDARGLSILDDGMFADDQQHRHSWNESSSPAIRTAGDIFTPMDDDAFPDNRWIGQLIAVDWLSSFQDDTKVGQLYTRYPRDGQQT